MRNQYFNSSRFLQLLKLEGLRSYDKTLFAGLSIFAFLMFLILIMASDHDFFDFHRVWYGLVLLAGGYLFTSTSLSELNTEHSRMGYLSLPASTFEKFASKFLITNIGYIAFATSAYWLFSIISNALCGVFFDFQFEAFNPFDRFYGLFMLIYFMTQSIFLLGAATFNRFTIFKTFLSMVVVNLVLASIIYLFIRIIFYDVFDGMFAVRDNVLYRPNENFIEFFKHSLPNILQFISYFIIVPMILAAGYFKLKEREV
jgi:hypothetical protein